MTWHLKGWPAYPCESTCSVSVLHSFFFLCTWKRVEQCSTEIWPSKLVLYVPSVGNSSNSSSSSSNPKSVFLTVPAILKCKLWLVKRHIWFTTCTMIFFLGALPNPLLLRRIGAHNPAPAKSLSAISLPLKPEGERRQFFGGNDDVFLISYVPGGGGVL